MQNVDEQSAIKARILFERKVGKRDAFSQNLVHALFTREEASKARTEGGNSARRAARKAPPSRKPVQGLVVLRYEPTCGSLPMWGNGACERDLPITRVAFVM